MSFFVAKLRFSWYIGAKQIKETILVNKKEKAKAVIEIAANNIFMRIEYIRMQNMSMHKCKKGLLSGGL